MNRWVSGRWRKTRCRNCREDDWQLSNHKEFMLPIESSDTDAHVYNSSRVGRNRISFTSTSSGWLMASDCLRKRFGRNCNLIDSAHVLGDVPVRSCYLAVGSLRRLVRAP